MSSNGVLFRFSVHKRLNCWTSSILLISFSQMFISKCILLKLSIFSIKSLFIQSFELASPVWMLAQTLTPVYARFMISQTCCTNWWGHFTHCPTAPLGRLKPKSSEIIVLRQGIIESTFPCSLCACACLWSCMSVLCVCVCVFVCVCVHAHQSVLPSI